jgi:hypothetical protein
MFKFSLDPCIIHGTPITPRRLLPELRGGSFCVSFADPRDLDSCIQLQGEDGMLMLDNGAFSHWRAGKGQIDRNAFFAWANAAQDRCAVAVAVVPDVIEGSEEQNWLEAAYAVRELSDYPERLMFCWHMNDSLDQLERACRLFNFVAIGSCAEFDIQRDRQAYLARLREANHVINMVEAIYKRRPWIHLMRGLAVLKDAIRFQSADSTNIARNHCRLKGKVERRAAVMHDKIAAPIVASAEAAPIGPTTPTSNFDEAWPVEERLAA